MEKLGLKACIDALRGNRSLAECMNMLINAEYDELFANSNEWFTEAVAYMKKTNSPEAVSQLLLTLCHFCQFTFMSERVDIESDLKKRIFELGERVAEGQSLIKQQPQYAAVVYATEAAFYLYVAALNARLNKKNRQAGSRSAFDSSCAALALCYDLSTRASSHFIELSSSPSTNESKILAQAERINALNCAVAGAMLVERFRSVQQQTARSSGGPDTWTARLPNLFAESQACLKRTLDVKDNSPITTVLCYSSPNSILSSAIPCLPDLLPLFERVLSLSIDLQALVWCTVHLRRLFPILATSSHQYTDALVVEALAKGEALRRCSHLPSSLIGDFSSPSADALCQVDVIAFILMAAARVELSLPPPDESVCDSIQPPFVTNSLGSTELGGESFWLTHSQLQWWRAVTMSQQQGQQQQQLTQDPFTKFRLIQDGLFLLRLSGIDAKLSYLAIRVAEAFEACVLEHYFNTIRQETDAKFTTTVPSDVRRFHVYCCKYWDCLLQSIHAVRSTPHGHHTQQRISLGGTGVPPSRQQRFFEPFPLLASSGVGASLETISSELRNRVTILANFYLGFDAFLNGNLETSVKLLKACSSELTLANFFEGRAFEAMAEEAHEKSLRTPSSTSSSWVVRQLYESALTAYDKAVNYTQTNTQQVQRALVVEAAAKSAARIKKNLAGGSSRKEEATSSAQRLSIVPVNGDGGVESPPLPSVVQQQQQAMTLMQQQQEQSIGILNNTVGQLVPAIRDLSSAARDLADVARQLRDLERQLRESVVRIECGVQQQQQQQQQQQMRPPSSATTSTPPVAAAGAGGITAEQLLPLLMDLIRERNMPPPVAPHAFMSPSVTSGQPSLLMRQLAAPLDTSTMVAMNQPMVPSFGMVQTNLDLQQQQFPPTCTMAGPSQFQQQPPPQPHSSSAFGPIIPPPAPTQPQTAFPQQQRVPAAIVPTTTVSAPSPAAATKEKKPEPSKPVPAAAAKKQPEKSLADLFKPTPGSWSCSTCLVRNNEAAERCAACETPKPGATPATTRQLPQITFPPPATSTTTTPKPTTVAQGSPAASVFSATLFPKPTGEMTGFQFGAASPLFGAPKTGATTTTTTTTPSTKPPAAEPIFKGIQLPAAPTEAVKTEPKEAEEETGESPEEFVPTAEYHPIAELPQNYEIVTGEENEERLFCEKAKLYRWAEATNEWKERGVGEMKVLRNKETNRSRILMRREQVLKPCANHYITPDFSLRPFSAVGDRGFCWLAADFAEVESGEQPQLMQLAIRFRNAEAAQEFKKAVETCRSKATPLTKSPVKPAKPKAEEKPQEITAPKTTTPPTITSPAVGSQPSGLPVPVFGSLFVKKTEAAPTMTTSTGGLFSFAALAAANPKPGEAPETVKATGAPFVGQPEPLFKNLLAKTTPTPAGKSTQEHEEGRGEEGGEEGEQPDAFVPTSEYKPVVELPSDYKHVSGEEGFERVFSERCKLYRWDSNTNEWKERGIGDIRLLKATDGSSKHRIVMRREHIHTVCANHYLTITPSMKLGRLPSAADRAVTWFTPSDYSDGEAKLETLCARFKVPAVADQFSSCFKAALDELAQKYGSGSGVDKSPAKPPTNENTKPAEVPGEKPQVTPSFSFAPPAQSPAITIAATTTTTTTGSITPATNLFGSSSFSNANKPSPAVGEVAPNTTPFSGFRFGQLGGPGTPTSHGSKPALFGGSSGTFGGNAVAPGNFSFSGVFPTSGASSGAATDIGGTKGTTMSGENDSECVLVSHQHASPDEVARARQFLLPDDFYLYRLRKSCSGCPGCDDENNENVNNSAKEGDDSKPNASSSQQTANSLKSQIPTPSFSSH